MRRRGRKCLTEAQRKKLIRQDELWEKQKQRDTIKRKSFYVEYSKICRKYGCYISENFSMVYKVPKGEKIYTLTSHLESVRESLKD